MGMDESLLTGESVLTAAQSPGGNGTGSGGGLAVALAFSGLLIDAESGGLVDFAANIGTEQVAAGNNQVDPIGFPVSARTITSLRANVPTGNGAAILTFTLYKNGVATSLTCTIAAHAGANTTAVDNAAAHAVTFANGDRLDVRVSATAPMGQNVGFSGTVEGFAGGTGAFPGFGGAPPAVAGAGAAGASGLASRSDHTHQGVASVASADSLIPVNTAGAAVTVGPQMIQANWAAANVRWYALDGTNGNDANAGFSDASSAAAGLVAKKTLAGLGAIFPRNGAGRKVVLVIASGTYTGGLELVLSDCSGYAANFPLVVGTGTNATANAVAFAGDAADRIYAGAVTVTGLNASGYNPTGTPTQTTIQCLKVGGGAPGFPAEPGDPMGWRIRFDVNTTTAALRGLCFPIIGLPASDTLSFPNVVTGAGGLPAVPALTDTFYVEMAGVNVATALVNMPNQPYVDNSQLGFPQLVGINMGTTFSTVRLTSPGIILCFCGAQFAEFAGEVECPFFYIDETGATRTPGASLKAYSGITTQQAPQQLNFLASSNCPVVASGSVVINNGGGFCWGNGAYSGNLTLSNVKSQTSINAATNQGQGIVGGRTANGQSPIRVVGRIRVNGSDIIFGRCSVTGAGANPAIALQGKCFITVDSTLTGSSGNTNVGLDLTGAADSTICITSAPTVTGTTGDIRLSDGTIISWATAAAGVIDANGNRLYTPGNAPSHPIAVATGAGVLAPTNAPGGATTYLRYFKIPDGAGGFYTIGSTT